MYASVDGKPDFVALEKATGRFWKENSIFERTVDPKRPEKIFYDGPPFATGSPHYGTVFVSIIKDAVARFFTMTGYSVPRRWGWDCHGLPIENAVERQLDIGGKKEIESRIGVKKFNDACRGLVNGYNDAWEVYIDRIGRWVDYRHPYRTMDTGYMESILHVFKECCEKGLIYRDYRVTPYCYRCETSLSLSDIRESDSTRPRKDPAVTVALECGRKFGGMRTSFLVWTTTPWTLPSNMALAVGPAVVYFLVVKGGRLFILAGDRLNACKRFFGDDAEVFGKISGAELNGLRYTPPFDFAGMYAEQGAFRVITADFVDTAEGTGIVHLAPAFGEDDYAVCAREGVPFFNPVDDEGKFTDEIPGYAGVNVHDANGALIDELSERGLLIDREEYVHNYPHCWRCRTPLIYRAMDAWYFKVTAVKEAMIELNRTINWVPETVRDGRFGNWLENARDWNVSRNRYWGTPIPIWICGSPGCGRQWVAGSIAELEAAGGKKIGDLHKEHLDPIEITCGCGGIMRRVPEVLDCWFESAAMPYAQCHYPFENKTWFEDHFPSDFIIEYTGQIRAWFYYLHVLAVALFDRPAFKNCLVHGTLLTGEGTKMSKSRANYTEPLDLLDRYGADALRLYLLSSPAVALEDLRFCDDGPAEQLRNTLIPLWNCLSFFVTYANIDGYDVRTAQEPKTDNLMDRWILASLHDLCGRVRTGMESFDLQQAVRDLCGFTADISNWYIRRSRDRFWDHGLGRTKRDAYAVLHYVLVAYARLLAPVIPFFAEFIHRTLTDSLSVHLEPFPDVPARFSDPDLVRQMAAVRKICSLGMNLRQQSGIRTRQPLGALYLVVPADEDGVRGEDFCAIIREELNVKEIVPEENPDRFARLRIVPDPRILGPRFGKDIQEIIRCAKLGMADMAGDEIVVRNGKHEWRFPREEASVRYESREGFNAAGDAGVVLAFDSAVPPELVEEGIANDLNRIIQRMRRDAGYKISDRIVMEVEGDLDRKYLDALYVSALADRAEAVRSGCSEAVEIGGREFVVRIARDRHPGRT